MKEIGEELRGEISHPPSSAFAGWRFIVFVNTAAIVLILIGGALVAARVFNNTKTNKHNAAINTRIICSLGRAFTNAPIFRQPVQTEAQFVDSLHRTQRLIDQLRVRDCKGIGRLHVVQISLTQAKVVKEVVPGSGGNPSGGLGGGSGSGSGPSPQPQTPPLAQLCLQHPDLQACVNVPSLP